MENLLFFFVTSEHLRYRENNNIDFPTASFEEYKDLSPVAQKRTYAYFVVGTAAMGGLVAVRSAVVGLIQTMSASADVLALANVEVDLSTISEGTSVTLKWRGKPLFVRHRTPEDISQAENTPLSELKDPQPDSVRVKPG
jgi:ubiquinol-cytochrome c reductase iron-sulfur subunit